MLLITAVIPLRPIHGKADSGGSRVTITVTYLTGAMILRVKGCDAVRVEREVAERFVTLQQGTEDLNHRVGKPISDVRRYRSHKLPRGFRHLLLSPLVSPDGTDNGR